jgi:hypothetical protein
VEDKKNDAQGMAGEANQEQQGFVKQFGGMSDQGRQVKAYEEAAKARKEAQERFEKLNAPGATMESTGSYEGEYEELEAKLKEQHAIMDQKAAGLDAARKALESGKGLKFDGLKGDAEKAKNSKDEDEKIGAADLEKALAQAAQVQQQIDNKRKTAEDALNKATDALTKIREAEVESERALALKRLQLQAAEMKDSVDFAKAGTAQVTADKEAADKQRKQAREEQARKLENDAKAAEQRGDHDAAAKLHTQAAQAKLPDNATPEQKRQADLEAKERAAKAKPTTISAGGVTDPLSNLAASLGPAGVELGKAVNKLKDGADGKELQAVLNHLTELTPLIQKQFGANEQTKKKLDAVEKQLASLKSQLRSTQL